MKINGNEINRNENEICLILFTYCPIVIRISFMLSHTWKIGMESMYDYQNAFALDFDYKKLIMSFDSHSWYGSQLGVV